MNSTREKIAAVLWGHLPASAARDIAINDGIDALEAIVREEVRAALNEAAGLAKDEGDSRPCLRSAAETRREGEAMNTKPDCALCGKPIDGLGTVVEPAGENAVGIRYLCHPDDRTKTDYYHLWTAYGKRPEPKP